MNMLSRLISTIEDPCGEQQHIQHT
jgi:hypothetical protein